MEYTILVVDDEEGMREVLQFDLEMEGYKCLTAESGNKALVIIEQENVHLVLSDMRMPDGDGIFLLKEIRKRHPEIPIVALITGYADYNDNEVLEMGAQVILSKPYDVDELKKIVKNLLSNSSVAK